MQARERAQALAEMKARQAMEAKLLAEEEQALQVWVLGLGGGRLVLVKLQRWAQSDCRPYQKELWAADASPDDCDRQQLVLLCTNKPCAGQVRLFRLLSIVSL